MSELEQKIDRGFYRADSPTPSGQTVGDLIEILKKLPKDLPVNHGDPFDEDKTFFVTVYNIGLRPFVEIEQEDLCA